MSGTNFRDIDFPLHKVRVVYLFYFSIVTTVNNMATGRQEMSVEQKQVAVELYLQGEKQCKLAELFSVHKSTISRVLQKFNNGEGIENSQNRGRPNFVDERGDRRLLRQVKNNRRQTLQEISNNYNQHAPKTISTRTVQRKLHSFGMKRHRVRKTLTVSEPNRKSRVKWCKSMKNKNIDDYWKKVIFSDETQVVISNQNRLYVWRTESEAYSPECVGKLGRNTRLGVMFWGCITHEGPGTLTPIQGTMNSETYISTLDEHLWPVIAKDFGNSEFIFQDDNAPCHASLQTRTWKTENDINILNWPSQSPDINIIENVWHIMKIRLNKCLETIRTREDLINQVMRIWASLTAPYIQALYQTIPRRLKAVIDSKGHITKY